RIRQLEQAWLAAGAAREAHAEGARPRAESLRHVGIGRRLDESERYDDGRISRPRGDPRAAGPGEEEGVEVVLRHGRIDTELAIQPEVAGAVGFVFGTGRLEIQRIRLVEVGLLVLHRPGRPVREVPLAELGQWAAG